MHVRFGGRERRHQSALPPRIAVRGKASLDSGASQMTKRAAICLGTSLFLAASGTTDAQTIYPLNRAEILSGSRLDLKVEFPGAPPAAAMRVTINGADAASVVGKSASVIEREDGGDYSAFWIRDTALKI